MATPKTISTDIIARLNALGASGKCKEISELEKARFKKDIEALKGKDYASAMMAYGMFYALLGDKDNAFKYHESAIQSGVREVLLFSNYAITLAAYGYLDKAADNYFRALKISPQDKGILLQAAEVFVTVGRLKDLFELVDAYVRLTRDDTIMAENSVTTATKIQRDLKALGVSEADMSYAYKRVEVVCKKFGVNPKGYLVSRYDAEGHGYLGVDVPVTCAGKELSAMNDLLAEMIAEDLDFQPWNKLIHTFVYAPRFIGENFATSD